MPEPLRLPPDALDMLLRSDVLRDVLDMNAKVDGARDWATRYAETTDVVSVVARAAGAVFVSFQEAEQELLDELSGGGFGIRKSLRDTVLSLLQPMPVMSAGTSRRSTSRDEDLASATAACLFAATNRDLIPSQRRKIINDSLWLLTEKTPALKYQTRYRSHGARDIVDPKLLAHEHMMQRKPMVDRILATSSPAQIRSILGEAVGCTVLREPEHRALGAVKGVDGWERYRQADVLVYDCGEDGHGEPRLVSWVELGLD